MGGRAVPMPHSPSTTVPVAGAGAQLAQLLLDDLGGSTRSSQPTDGIDPPRQPLEAGGVLGARAGREVVGRERAALPAAAAAAARPARRGRSAPGRAGTRSSAVAGSNALGCVAVERRAHSSWRGADRRAPGVVEHERRLARPRRVPRRGRRPARTGHGASAKARTAAAPRSASASTGPTTSAAPRSRASRDAAAAIVRDVVGRPRAASRSSAIDRRRRRASAAAPARPPPTPGRSRT